VVDAFAKPAAGPQSLFAQKRTNARGEVVEISRNIWSVPSK